MSNRNSRMRNGSFAALGTLILLAAASAYGQAVNGDAVKPVIPFKFQVGQTVLPAGQYQVTMDGLNHELSLACLTCKGRVSIATSGGGSDDKARSEGVLVFNRYGDRYFLSEVRLPYQAQGRAVPESRIEHELARNSPPAQTTQVLVAER